MIKLPPKSILICRTDKLGDFILTLPSFKLIKKSFPDTKIVALIQEYTKPVAENCDYIDEIISIPNSGSKFSNIIKTIKILKTYKFDASISLFTNTTLAISLFFSKIPFRLSPATKIDQILYNYTLRQNRSHSIKPEFEYNLDLIKFYIQQQNCKPLLESHKPYLSIDKNTIKHYRELFCNNNILSQSSNFIFIHVGSGGSANNLSPKQYACLIELLSLEIDAVFVLCQGPEDKQNVEQTLSELSNTIYVKYTSNTGLLDFIKHIAFTNIFISGSTGPLHIAGALDIPTIGFYPNRRSATSTRWKTLNSDKNLISFSPESISSEDMTTININKILPNIVSFIQKHLQ